MILCDSRAELEYMSQYACLLVTSLHLPWLHDLNVIKCYFCKEVPSAMNV
jgi:hypothetical protein